MRHPIRALLPRRELAYNRRRTVAGSRLLIAASVWLLSAGWAVIGALERAGCSRAAASRCGCRSQRSSTQGGRRPLLRHVSQPAHEGRRTSRSTPSTSRVQSANAQVWEDVVRKLRTRSMPPQGMPRPDEATYVALTTLARDRAGSGRRCGAESRPSADSSSQSQRVRQRGARSARARRRRLVAAAARRLGIRLRQRRRTCSARRRRCSSAISSPPIASARWPSARRCAPGSNTYRVRQDRSQDQHIEGLPLGIGRRPGRHAQLPAGRRVSLLARALSHEPRGDSRSRAPASDRDHD